MAKKKGSAPGALSDDALFDCFAFEIYSTTTRCVPGEEVRRAGIDVRALAHHLLVAQFEPHERAELEHELSQAFSLYKAGNYAGAEAKVVAVFRAAVASQRSDEQKANEPILATGAKVRRPFQEANRDRSLNATALHAKWQAQADLLWSNPLHAGKSKSDIARLVAQKLGGNQGTIRQAIKRPKS
ncbi:hypothetical protein [Pseudoxanthomonas japonensis]|uniref:hypothetical protein n=1 Tax=Pseudoxanthomonas japonensis TaxID=69284 RepID=UPI001BCF13D8|nr:hypothetical protein [Pseudoxanthomonas japonensis]